MTVISLFDGMSCGQIAINKLGWNITNYFASEVDKYAISVTQHNYPNTIQVGDVSKLQVKKYRTGVRLITEHGERYFIKGKIWLIGGSPCQGFSFAGKMNGSSTKCKIEITNLDQYLKLKEDGFEFEGQSYLFWEYIRILREINPDIFLLENVRMKKKWWSMFDDAVGYPHININSSLVSAQSRPRFYWTNIEHILPPEDEGIVIADILEDIPRRDSRWMDLLDYMTEKFDGVCRLDKGVYSFTHEDKGASLTTGATHGNKYIIHLPEATKKGFTKISNSECFDASFPKSRTRRGRNMQYKSNCLTASNFEYMLFKHPKYRKLTPTECERLQTVPDGYTSLCSNSQRYKMLGNGWTIKVISHILLHYK